MSTNYQPKPRRDGMVIALLAVCVCVLLTAAGCSDAPKPATPGKADDKAKASASNTNNLVEYDVQSVFDDDPRKTKDPFFPKSNRRIGKAVVGKLTAETAKVADLHLRGVIGSPGRFIAMINDKTFANGEKSQVTLSPGQYLVVKVIKISERSVTVSVDGEATPRELTLEPTQEAKK